MKDKKLYIGTSGWQYNHWNKRFYPEDVPKKRWLGFYSGEFNTVEANGTFYGPVKKKTFEKWHDAVPYDFKFSLKGSRWITHMKKLSGVDKAVEKFYKDAGPLKRRLGCILWQLPPMLKKDLDRLDSFCSILDKRKKNVIEFRHKSWWSKDVYGLLEKNNIAFCSVSGLGMPADPVITADFAYFRFHGPGKSYASSYSARQLKTWAQKIKKAAKNCREICCYFNNDYCCYAVENAKKLKEMI